MGFRRGAVELKFGDGKFEGPAFYGIAKLIAYIKSYLFMPNPQPICSWLLRRIEGNNRMGFKEEVLISS
jgi:hypothetical protein